MLFRSFHGNSARIFEDTLEHDYSKDAEALAQEIGQNVIGITLKEGQPREYFYHLDTFMAVDMLGNVVLFNQTMLTEESQTAIHQYAKEQDVEVIDCEGVIKPHKFNQFNVLFLPNPHGDNPYIISGKDFDKDIEEKLSKHYEVISPKKLSDRAIWRSVNTFLKEQGFQIEDLDRDPWSGVPFHKAYIAKSERYDEKKIIEAMSSQTSEGQPIHPRNFVSGVQGGVHCLTLEWPSQ